MSTFNYDKYTKKFDYSLLDRYTSNEKKRALQSQSVSIWRTFTDSWTQENVDELAALFKSNSTIAPLVREELMNMTTSRKCNVFDGSSYVPLAVDSVTVNPNYLSFFKFCEESESSVEKKVYMTGGSFVGEEDAKPNGTASIMRLYGAIVSTTGSDTKARSASSKAMYAVNAAIANDAADTLKERGREEDVINHAMSALLARPDSFEVLQGMRTVVQASVPKERVITTQKVEGVEKKKIQEFPVLALDGKEEARWARNYSVVDMPVKMFTSNLDTMETCLAKKGPGKWADDSYLGVPMGHMRSQTFHKVTLDDAGVKVGDSLYVHTSDAMLIEFLRSNYGHKVVGSGSLYPMLSLKQIAGKRFDWVYLPGKLRTSLSGDLYVSKRNLTAIIEEKLRLPCHGQLIAYISPLVAICPDYEGTFYTTKAKVQYTDKLVEGEPKGIRGGNFPNKSTTHGALTDFKRVNEVWYPPDVADVTRIKDTYIMRMLETSTLITHDTYRGRKEFSEDERALLLQDLTKTDYISKYLAEIRSANNILVEDTLENRFRFEKEFEKVMIKSSSWKDIEIKARISIGSWKGVLLFSEGLPSAAFDDLAGQLLSSVKHAMRCVWRLSPLSKNSYTINKIKSRVSTVGMSFFESFESVYSNDLLKEIQRREQHGYSESDFFEEIDKEEEEKEEEGGEDALLRQEMDMLRYQAAQDPDA